MSYTSIHQHRRRRSMMTHEGLKMNGFDSDTRQQTFDQLTLKDEWYRFQCLNMLSNIWKHSKRNIKLKTMFKVKEPSNKCYFVVHPRPKSLKITNTRNKKYEHQTSLFVIHNLPHSSQLARQPTSTSMGTTTQKAHHLTPSSVNQQRMHKPKHYGAEKCSKYKRTYLGQLGILKNYRSSKGDSGTHRKRGNSGKVAENSKARLTDFLSRKQDQMMQTTFKIALNTASIFEKTKNRYNTIVGSCSGPKLSLRVRIAAKQDPTITVVMSRKVSNIFY